MVDIARTLVTGFGAFGEVADNPSAHVAAGCGRPFRVLPVTFAAVDAWLDELDPATFDRWIMLGVAANRAQITPEMFARNQIGERPDVDGVVRDGPIESEGSLLLEGTLWTPEILSGFELHKEIEASLDAGGYLCNYIYYRALRRFPDKRCGFLHLPPVTAIPLERQADLLSEILATCEGSGVARYR